MSIVTYKVHPYMVILTFMIAFLNCQHKMHLILYMRGVLSTLLCFSKQFPFVYYFYVTITNLNAGAVDELGQMPYYAEHCAAMLAVTYSSGQGHQRNIVS